MPSFKDTLRSWRRRLKAHLPYVRRREHRVLQRKYAELIEALDGGASPASEARLKFVKPLPADLGGEVCLFVTYADTPRIKPHVVAHAMRLIDARIEVVLIVNTELPPDALTIDPTLLERTRAIAIRQNLGYDFGAWAHLLALCPGMERWSRLFLVNDSIVGPLDPTAFERMLARIRTSQADVVGLTEALLPRRHLQSYFLAFGPRALRGGAVGRVFGRVRNWPDKGQVIDIHESRLTALLEAEGLRCEALFPSLSGDPLSSDDTSLRWAELVRAGFPYLKTRVIASHPGNPQIEAWLEAYGAATR
ncbi:MAG: rhamnan synthesis F family protein [Caldimonas sp.]